MELYYSDSISSNQIFLDEEESIHCIKVMRHRIGDKLMVTDGAGKLFHAEITGDSKKEVLLEILEVKKEESVPFPDIHIAIAPTKTADRFEWFLEKATEIGVSEITPIVSQRSERDKIKHDRLNKILIASMKQSLRLWMPRLNPITPLKSIFNSIPILSGRNSKFIAHCQSQNLSSLKSLYQPKQSVILLVGPEGDFTREEITLAEENGFVSVSLSEARLRTETAGMVVVHTVHLLNS